jgi:hypothetical protein
MKKNKSAHTPRVSLSKADDARVLLLLFFALFGFFIDIDIWKQKLKEKWARHLLYYFLVMQGREAKWGQVIIKDNCSLNVVKCMLNYHGNVNDVLTRIKRLWWELRKKFASHHTRVVRPR